MKKLNKKIFFLLIISIVSINFTFFSLPQNTNAQFSVPILETMTGGKNLWDLAKDAGIHLLSQLAKSAGRRLVMEITQVTVDWINSGFNGKASYPGNIGDFLRNTADRAVGDFIQSEPSLNFLCDPFKLQVQASLIAGFGKPSSLSQRLGCTLSGVVGNATSALANASVNVGVQTGSFTSGGWNTWLNENTVPQNNPYGAYMIAKGALDASIQTTQGAKTQELGFGQGALTFKRCYDTYQTPEGAQVGTKSDEYTEGGDRPAIPNVGPMVNTPGGLRSNVTAIQHCEVKTPGATITSMLGARANSEGNMDEMSSAISNGLDSILSALASLLISTVTKSLAAGILDTSPSTTADLSAGLSSLDTSAWDTYNSTMDNLDSTNPKYTRYNQLSSINATGNGVSDTGIVGETISSGNNTATYSASELTRAANNASTLITSLQNSELAYQYNYKVAQRILTEAKTVFVNAVSCNIARNNSSAALRAVLIRANIITNIDGDQDTNRTPGVAQIPWNLQVTTDALAQSNSHIILLNQAVTGVSGAKSFGDITNAMIPVNSTSFNTDPQDKMTGNIKTWLRGLIPSYSVSPCVIDLTSVLNITTPTTVTP